jgi:arabinogalactan endo-1,4-beta-galactosidase
LSSHQTTVLLHLTNINNGIDSLTSVPFDMIGLSYYGYWHGSLRDLQTAIRTLAARYDKDVLVLETAYPWTIADNPKTPLPT